jgi:hypothetical protein
LQGFTHPVPLNPPDLKGLGKRLKILEMNGKRRDMALRMFRSKFKGSGLHYAIFSLLKSG